MVYIIPASVYIYILVCDARALCVHAAPGQGNIGSLTLPVLISSCVQALSRTYAQSVAGLTQMMAYNNITQDFTLVYITVKECTSTVSEVAGVLGLWTDELWQ